MTGAVSVTRACNHRNRRRSPGSRVRVATVFAGAIKADTAAGEPSNDRRRGGTGGSLRRIRRPGHWKMIAA